MSANEQSSGAGVSEGAEDAQIEGVQESAGIQRIGELLAADEPDDDASGDAGGESSGSGEKAKPTKFNDLAGAAELDLEALYKLEVTLEGVDNPVSIEKLKDFYKGANDFDLKVLEFEEKRTEDTNELVRAKAELQEILSTLPANAVKPEVLEKIRAKAEQTSVEEKRKTLEVIPEWQDQDARLADLTAIAEHLQGYGFPANYLSQVVSHQHLRYMRDNMLRERRIKAALSKVRSGKPTKSGKAPVQGKAPSKGQTSITPKTGQSKLEAMLSSID